MAALTDDEIDQALARGAAAARAEPRAASARYDRAGRRVVVELTDGRAFAFPARLCAALAAADDDALAAITVSPGGYGLRWEALDVDLSVPGLLAGHYSAQPNGAARALGEDVR
jgi:hypothetical protein